MEAVVSGDVAALGPMLREDPELARARSMRRHHATLLHYVAANGVEGGRQKTPQNVVEVARVLLDAGAEVDAIADMVPCPTLAWAWFPVKLRRSSVVAHAHASVGHGTHGKRELLYWNAPRTSFGAVGVG